MKKTGILLLGIGLIVGYVFWSKDSSKIIEKQSVPTKPIAQHTNDSSATEIRSKTLFVPYWNIPSALEVENYDRLIYFGITPDDKGELKTDTGYTNISQFIDATSSSKERLLAVRMLDADTNISVFKSNRKQKKIIDETIALVDTYGFDGVVLDLEMSVIPFTEVQNDITVFSTAFAKDVHNHNLNFMMTIYGDTFYRGRPYDVNKLGTISDELLIMAYDFHKSRGEPGPNFPFDRTSGYDFQQMVRDFSKTVDSDKLTIIFGMYGYDWTLGEQGLPLKVAQAIPLHEIESAILPGCSGDCKITTDTASMETKITYTDSDGYEHELWFEDEDSVEVKMKYLKEQGIGSVGYWVWGYF